MEKIKRIVEGNPLTSSVSNAISKDSEWMLRRNLLGQILVAYREVVQWGQIEDSEEIEVRVAAWLPITTCIPANRLFDCYVWALQNRTSNFPLSAQELVQAWRAIQDRNETSETRNKRGQKLLPENAAAACRRCFGTGREQMLGGGVKDSCDHRPLTQEEEEAFIRERVAQIEKVRGKLKPEEAGKLK